MPRPKPRKTTHANLARRDKMDERVEELLDIIESGAYMGRPTLKRKAEEWGISLKAAYDVDAQAYRVLRFKYRDDPELRTKIYARLEGLVNVALGKFRYERRKNKASPSGYELIKVPDPDVAAAKAILELLGREHGMFDPGYRNNYNYAVGRLIDTAEQVLGADAAQKLLEAVVELGDPKREEPREIVPTSASEAPAKKTG